MPIRQFLFFKVVCFSYDLYISHVILDSKMFQVIGAPEVFESKLQTFSQGCSIICLNSQLLSKIAILNGY